MHIKIIKDYLSCEYEALFKEEKEFPDLEALFLDVPSQNNFYDCSLFVLEYAENFFIVSIHQVNQYFSIVSNHVDS